MKESLIILEYRYSNFRKWNSRSAFSQCWAV